MLLVELLGSENVYYQSPESVKMQYPAIVYNRDDIRIDYADNKPYAWRTRYSITVIDPNPDSEIPHKIAGLPLCSYSRHFTADNLNHDVFELYF
jgi:hypothetical protein